MTTTMPPSADHVEQRLPSGPAASAQRGLVPLPLSDDYDHSWPPKPSTHTGTPDPADPSDVVDMWGHCARFCESSDSSQTSGLTVGEHGVWCKSASSIFVTGTDLVGERADIGVQIAEPYLHGTYHRADVWASHARRTSIHVDVTNSGVTGDDASYDQTRTFDISVGDARRLAAGLLRAADVADRLDHDLAGAKARRASGR